jgi:hypothetical protein
VGVLVRVSVGVFVAVGVRVGVSEGIGVFEGSNGVLVATFPGGCAEAVRTVAIMVSIARVA